MKKAIVLTMAVVMICLTTACSGQGSAAQQSSSPAGDKQESSGAAEGVSKQEDAAVETAETADAEAQQPSL